MADQLLGAPKSDAVLRGKRDSLRDWTEANKQDTSGDRDRGFRPWSASDCDARIRRRPALVPFAGQDYWYSTRRWSGGRTMRVPNRIEVPKGFVTDFASIPCMFWTWLPRIGRYGLPSHRA